MSLVEFELAVIALLLLGILLKPSTDPHRMQQIADRLADLNKQLDDLLGRRDGEAIPQPAGERDQQS
jgi:uncharacterized protein YceH (UPF0502 family)